MNSFEIILKNNRAEIEILTTRALLAIAGVAAFVYAGERNYYSGVGLGLLLFLFSFFVKTILDKYKVNRLLLLGIAALFTYITTGSIAFSIVLLVHGVFFEMLNKKTKVEINNEAVIVHYVFYRKENNWSVLNNVILKDRILTIDFKNDHLVQSEIAEESYEVDEIVFNRFCAAQLQNNA